MAASSTQDSLVIYYGNLPIRVEYGPKDKVQHLMDQVRVHVGSPVILVADGQVLRKEAAISQCGSFAKITRVLAISETLRANLSLLRDLKSLSRALLPTEDDFAKLRVFCWCPSEQHHPHGADEFGDPYPQQLQLCSIRVRCSVCKSYCVEQKKRKVSWLDLYSTEHRGRCYTCDGVTNLEFFYQCGGELATPRPNGTFMCKGEVKDIVPCFVDEIRSRETPRRCTVVCQPCGHRVDANLFSEYFSGTVQDKLVINPAPLENKLGDYLVRCFDRSCKRGYFPYAVTAVLDYEKGLKIQAVQRRLHALSQGGILCDECNTPFIPSPEEREESHWSCPHCSTSHCREHRMANCRHDTLSDRIKSAILRGSAHRCPFCGKAGHKDDRCTRVECPTCFHSWCYVCESPSTLDYRCARGCPLLLGDNLYLDSVPPSLRNLEFHKMHVFALLRPLQREYPTRFDAALRSIPDASRTIISLVDDSEVHGCLVDDTFMRQLDLISATIESIPFKLE